MGWSGARYDKSKGVAGTVVVGPEKLFHADSVSGDGAVNFEIVDWLSSIPAEMLQLVAREDVVGEL